MSRSDRADEHLTVDADITDGRTARRVVNRESIITAARSIIATDGIEGLSIRSLADQVGLSVTTLYNLFGSKGDIIAAASEQVFAEMAPEAASVTAAGNLGELRDQLTNTFDGAIRTMTKPLFLTIMDDPTYARRFFVEHRAMTPIMSSFTDAIARKELLPSAKPDELRTFIESVISSTGRLWASGVVNDRERQSRIRSGIEIALLAHATAKGRRALLG